MMSAWAVMLIGLMAIEGMEAPAKKITAEAITKKMQQHIDKVEGLSAEFSISTYMAALNQHRESSGQLYILRKKSKLRLEQADQTIVSDGKSVWTYIPVNQQIIVMPAEASKAGIRPDEFLFFYTNHSTAYEIQNFELLHESSLFPSLSPSFTFSWQIISFFKAYDQIDCIYGR